MLLSHCRVVCIVVRHQRTRQCATAGMQGWSPRSNWQWRREGLGLHLRDVDILPHYRGALPSKLQGHRLDVFAGCLSHQPADWTTSCECHLQQQDTCSTPCLARVFRSRSMRELLPGLLICSDDPGTRNSIWWQVNASRTSQSRRLWQRGSCCTSRLAKTTLSTPGCLARAAPAFTPNPARTSLEAESRSTLPYGVCLAAPN